MSAAEPLSMTVWIAAPFTQVLGTEIKPVTPLDVQAELDAIADACEDMNVALNIEVHVATKRRLGQYFATRRILLDIFHFSGHGTSDKGLGSQLVLEDEIGAARSMNKDALEALLRPAGVPPCHIAVLNACHSEGLSEALVALHVPYIIVINAVDDILDHASRAFSRQFYPALLAGHSVEKAFYAALTAIEHEDTLERWGLGHFEAPKFKLLKQKLQNNEHSFILKRSFGHVQVQQPESNRLIQLLVATNNKFIGRQHQLLDLSKHLIRNKVRCLHVHGFAGMGKTSLVVEWARWAEQRQCFRDGIKAVQLRGWRDIDQARLQIALALGFDAKVAETDLSLCNAIDDRAMLLILDDLDSLLESQSRALKELLQALLTCRRLQLLTTSRFSLPASLEYKIYKLEKLTDNEARKALMSYNIPKPIIDDQEAVTKLLEVLDGYPFPIRLAAEYLKAKRCSIREYLQRFDSDFNEASRYPGDDIDRDTSLVKTLDLTYQALPDQAQRAFAYLSFFPGGILFDWFEQIMGQELARSIETLFSYSMADLSYDEDFRRIRLPEPARRYAESKVSSEEIAYLGLKVLHFYAERLKEWHEQMVAGQNPQTTVEVITKEWPNLEKWLRWGYDNEVKKSDICLSARATVWLERYWMLNGMQAQVLPKELLMKACQVSNAFGDIWAEANSMKVLGDLYTYRKELIQAKYSYDKAGLLQQNIQDNLQDANLLLALGEMYFFEKKLDLANQYYEQALNLYSLSSYPLGEGDVYRNLGDLLRYQGNIDEATNMYKRALTLYSSVNSIQGKAHALYSLASLYQYKSQLEQAEEKYQESLLLYNQINYILGQANVFYGLGSIYIDKNRLDKSQEYYNDALDLYSKIDFLQGKANVYHMLGNIYYLRRNIDRARDLYNNALDTFQIVMDDQGKANILTLLGNVYQELNEFDNAEISYNDAQILFDKINDRLGIANLYRFSGGLYKNIGKIIKSETLYGKALYLYKEIKFQQGIANTCVDLGELYYLQKKFARAQRMYEDAIEIYTSIKYSLGEANVYSGLSRLSLHRYEDEQALIYLDKAITLHKSMNSLFDAAIDLSNFGIALIHRGDKADAKPYLFEAALIFDQINLPNHAERIYTLIQSVNQDCDE